MRKQYIYKIFSVVFAMLMLVRCTEDSISPEVQGFATAHWLLESQGLLLAQGDYRIEANGAAAVASRHVVGRRPSGAGAHAYNTISGVLSRLGRMVGDTWKCQPVPLSLLIESRLV